MDHHFHIFSDPLQITRYFEHQMDNMLKDFGFGFNGFFSDTIPRDGPESNYNLRDNMLKEPDIDAIQPRQKVDTDLDGKISKEEVFKMWKEDKQDTETKIATPFSFNFANRHISKQIKRRPDGTVEQRQVFRDSEGNQQTIVSKEMDDKKYVVTTKKDKNGIESRSVDLFNMDESKYI
ncbi:hypothetical protein X777_02963 [Ooceraea biroi]|uniref:EF-hand domain-containing protein n=1 Tax=Ooceraea biroi TaxID=2015173 RepID=A0A026WMK0_OOCBI|nr:hypothetical protein X777_02963 [Ooceraea biroi]